MSSEKHAVSVGDIAGQGLAGTWEMPLTIHDAVARIKKDCATNVKAYDRVEDEDLKMSDMLAEGIVAHYPDKFK